MELQIVMGVSLFVVGVVAGRWSIHRRAGSNRTTGGIKYYHKGHLIQLDGVYVPQIYRMLKPHEQQQLIADVERGHLDAAEALWNEAVERWFRTDAGQNWLADHAPFLLEG